MSEIREPTKLAQEFIKENDLFGVVEGWATGSGGLGGSYRLSNGKVFKLSLTDCQSLPHNYPKWEMEIVK